VPVGGRSGKGGRTSTCLFGVADPAAVVALVTAAARADTRQEFSELFDIYMPVAGAVFVIVLMMLVVASLWRRRKEPSRREAAPKVETAYAVVLVVIAALLTWRTFDSMSEIDAIAGPTPAPVTAAAKGEQPYHPTIRVVAAKWTWRFEYGGGVVDQGTRPGDYATLVVPADTPVRFRLTSVDVVHAFWIPEQRFKFDAFPGKTSVFDMVFRRGLTYRDGRCAEFCGQYHSLMLFHVDVRAPADFRRWLARRKAAVRAGG
jgi:cytochrome c oxidase subunit II